MSQVLGWWPDDAMSAATWAIAFFALVQLGLAVARGCVERAAARARATGHAWLLRRTLEEVVRSSYDRRLTQWFDSVYEEKDFDRMEVQALQMLAEASRGGWTRRRAARKAFAEFLGYADCLHQMYNLPHSGRGTALNRYSVADQQTFRETARTALDHARAAIEAVDSKLAKREPHEPRLPGKDEVPPMLTEA